MNKYTSPNFSNSALITIDTQRDTLDGHPLEIKGTSKILPNMKKLLDCYRSHALPIVHVVRIYNADGSNADLCRKESIESGEKILAKGSTGAELAKELFDEDSVRIDPDFLLSGGIQNLSDHEVIIYKPRWGAFYQTPLHEYLQNQNIDSLVFSGCNFPNCPRTSMYEASERDYRVVLVEDALSGLYDRGKLELENIGVTVESTGNILNIITTLQTNYD
jgi:nicotinamidase-related amidase